MVLCRACGGFGRFHLGLVEALVVSKGFIGFLRGFVEALGGRKVSLGFSEVSWDSIGVLKGFWWFPRISLGFCRIFMVSKGFS